MPSVSASRRREILTLAADGCLITAGAFALLTGLAFGLDAMGVAPLGEPDGSGIDLLLSIASWLLQVSGFIVGPVLVWRLHRLQFNKRGILALVVGLVVGGSLAMPVAMLGAFFDWLVGLFTTTDYVGAIGYLVVIILVFLAVLAWLAADAFRDLSRTRRQHVALDVARLVAMIAIAVFASVVAAMILAGKDALEAFVFVLLAAVYGAGALAVASIVRTLGTGAAVPEVTTPA